MKNYNSIKYWAILIPTVLVIFLVFSVYTVRYTYKTTQIFMGGQTFSAEISDTRYLLEKGLSDRFKINNDHAMLFVFPEPGQYKFWMKDMNFPIDIIWLSSGKKIIYIEKNLSPITYPQSFGPDKPSRYVIEVASGTSNRLNLSVGQIVQF